MKRMIAGILTFVLLLSGCTSSNVQQTGELFIMSTYVTQQVYGEHADGAIHAVNALLEEYEAALSAAGCFIRMYPLQKEKGFLLQDDFCDDLTDDLDLVFLYSYAVFISHNTISISESDSNLLTAFSMQFKSSQSSQSKNKI